MSIEHDRRTELRAYISEHINISKRNVGIISGANDGAGILITSAGSFMVLTKEEADNRMLKTDDVYYTGVFYIWEIKSVKLKNNGGLEWWEYKKPIKKPKNTIYPTTLVKE